MYSSPSDSGLMHPEECSGNSGLLCHHCRRQEADSNVSLLSLATEEDDEVPFDSKQFFLPVFDVTVLFIPAYLHYTQRRCWTH